MNVEDGLSAIAAGLRERAEEFAGVLARDIVPVMPDMGSDGARQIRRSCAANIHTVAEVLDRAALVRADAVAVELPPPPPETMSYLRMLVHRSLDVDSLVRGYRIGHAALWRCCARVAFERVPQDGAPLAEVLQSASDIVFRFIDGATRHITDEFEVERHALMRWPVARKLRAVVALLDGDVTSAGDLDAALGYQLGGAHVAAVVKAADGVPPGGEPQPRAELIAVRLARLLSPGRPLVLPTGNETAWVWVADPPSGAAADAAQLQDIVADTGAVVGIGELGTGVEGFRETHAQAQEALEAAMTSGVDVARYRDVALLSVLLGDRARARRLSRHALGALDADTPAGQRLRETVWVLLAANLNQREAARRLGAHPHTIAYRLQQVEAALGRPLATCVHEVHAALLVRDALGGPASGT
ncbi:MAG TPA: helix-turn-helix domain-containing protein [Baekduia sp.]|nr:helix-turn-helix domain-containing protein [Baekduia sp.]